MLWIQNDRLKHTTKYTETEAEYLASVSAAMIY